MQMLSGMDVETTNDGTRLSKSFEEGHEPADYKSEPKGYTKEFIRKRLLIFAGLVAGYACFYITRNSFIYTAPVMVDAGVINMTQVQAPAKRAPSTRLFHILFYLWV